MVKIRSVTLVHALETRGERKAGFRFNNDPTAKDGNGWELEFNEDLRAVQLTSSRTKGVYLVPLELCKYVEIEKAVYADAVAPIKTNKKPALQATV